MKGAWSKNFQMKDTNLNMPITFSNIKQLWKQLNLVAIRDFKEDQKHGPFIKKMECLSC